MIQHLLAWFGCLPRPLFPIGTTLLPMIRHGRISGVRAARRLAKKRANRKRARHA